MLDRLAVGFGELGKLIGDCAPSAAQGLQHIAAPALDGGIGGMQVARLDLQTQGRQPAAEQQDVHVGAAPVLQREAGGGDSRSRL